MTPKQLKALAQRAEKATAVPWEKSSNQDLWFIARTDVPSLVAEVKALKAELEEHECFCSKCDVDWIDGNPDD